MDDRRRKAAIRLAAKSHISRAFAHKLIREFTDAEVAEILGEPEVEPADVIPMPEIEAAEESPEIDPTESI